MSEAEETEALYGAPLTSFIELRKAAAGRLRKGGDRDGAARLLAVAKPTPAAWAVNQLWRTELGAFEALLDVGERLRAALREAFAGRGNPGDPAALQKAQRAAVATLVTAAQSLLASAQVSSGQAVLDRIATTLLAISTTGWGEAPAGRLPKELAEADLASIASLLVDEMAPRAPRALRAEPSSPQAAASATARPSSSEPGKRAAPSSGERLRVRPSKRRGWRPQRCSR